MSNAPPKTATKTAYVVLKYPATEAAKAATDALTGGTQARPPSGIQDVATVEAASATAAIRSVVEKHGAGKYVAVPARSWKPVKVTVEQQTVVKVGDA
jgi:hypothetical protein